MPTLQREPQTDPEFDALLPPLSQIESQQLEQSLLAEGCREPLIAWVRGGTDGADVLVDGHNRYRICKAHNIPFEVRTMSFAGRGEAILWIVRNQIGRRNLNLYQRSVLALSLTPIIRAEAKRNQRLGRGRGRKGRKHTANPFQPIQTSGVLAEIAGTSAYTIKQVRRLDRYASKETKRHLYEGRISIRGAVHRTNLELRGKRRQEISDCGVEAKTQDEGHGVINSIICADVLEGLRIVPDASVHLIITSPPYGCGINYGDGSATDRMRYLDYLDWLSKVWVEAERVLVSGGRMAVVVDSLLNRDPEEKRHELRRPLFADLVLQMRGLGTMKYRDRIVWYKDAVVGNRAGFGSYLSPSNPQLLHNAEDILLWSKGDWQLAPPSEDAAGDLTADEHRLWSRSTWHIPTRLPSNQSHPCPFPAEIAERVIKMFCYPGQVVLDPFCGIGTVPVAACRLGRGYIGIDKSRRWCSQARAELSNLQ
ncbi:MAG: DNA modification methylase [Phycisphaerae bacterium]|nr:DNA modification methylase [Phycisphaerae bacterium]